MAWEQAWPCGGRAVRPANLLGRANNPLHGQAFEKFNLLIYWFQKSGITYTTLEMIKICPKRRLFDDKNEVFWKGSASRFGVATYHHSNQFHMSTSGPHIFPSGQSFAPASITWQGGSCTHLGVTDKTKLAVQGDPCTCCSGSPARQEKNLIRARSALLQNA